MSAKAPASTCVQKTAWKPRRFAGPLMCIVNSAMSRPSLELQYVFRFDAAAYDMGGSKKISVQSPATIDIGFRPEAPEAVGHDVSSHEPESKEDRYGPLEH